MNVFSFLKVFKFREDIAAGRDVTLKDYIKDDKTDYTNGIARLGLDISYFIENTFNKGMNAFFEMLNEAVSS